MGLGGLKHFPAARQIMNVQALFHYQERGIALTASRLFIKCMVSPDSGIFSPTFKVWALEIIGDNCCAHPNNNGAESAIAQLPIAARGPLMVPMPELTAPTRQQKITLGEMRSSGVRGLLVYCADYKCAHAVRISADRWADEIRLSDLEPLFICRACGRRGADIRPDFHWDRNQRLAAPQRVD